MEAYEFLRSVESNARTYASSFHAVFEQAQGIRVRDDRGREYLDCLACAGALPLGHNHPEIQEAVHRFLSSNRIQQALDLTTAAKYEFVRCLWSLLPEDFANHAKIQFCSPSGSDAVEAALKLVRFATRRNGIIAFGGGYHGMTGGALAAMGNVLPKAGQPSSAVQFMPYPDRSYCPFGSDGSQSDKLSSGYLRTVLADPESGVAKPAGLLLEVVQGEGGCVPASAEWLREVRALTREFDVPLIVDEVQTGVGRTGKTFAFEHAGIVPDVLVLSKAIGGGYPLSVVVYHEKLDVWPRGMHAGTFRGNQIAMVAGRATMGVVQRDRLHENAARMGASLADGLREIGRRHDAFADVRGRGLMLGAEVGRPGGSSRRGPREGELAKRVKNSAFAHGLLIETGGRHGTVLRLLPPLNISETEVGAVLDRLDSAVHDAVKGGAHA